MEKYTNNTYKISQEEELTYTQLALFNLDTSDLAVSPLIEADHTPPRDKQSVVDNKEHDVKGYFTPKEIIHLMVELLDPRPETTVYDPCCGSGASLIAVLQYLEKEYPGRSTALFGQEPRSELCAQAKTALSH